MRAEGLEPPRAHAHRHLKPACLPFHHARLQPEQFSPDQGNFHGGMSEDDREYVLDKPNRRKAASKATKAIVIMLLIASAVLMAIVAIGGFSKLQGALPVLVVLFIVYLVMAFFVGRWNRGVLPLAAALAILLGIFAAVAGPAWFERDATGFATPQSLFGGGGLAASVLGLITLLIVPVQVLLIAFAMRGFQQEWQTEVEVPKDQVPAHA